MFREHFAQTAERTTLIQADLHIHTVYSSDSLIQPKTLVDQLVAHSFIKVAAVTDHDSVRGCRATVELASKIHTCVYSAPFGVVPLELDEVYPLSQHEAALPLDLETVDYVASQTFEYIKRTTYGSVLLLNDAKLWKDTVKKACRSACRAKGLAFDSVDADVEGSKEILIRLENILRKQLSE